MFSDKNYINNNESIQLVMKICKKNNQRTTHIKNQSQNTPKKILSTIKITLSNKSMSTVQRIFSIKVHQPIWRPIKQAPSTPVSSKDTFSTNSIQIPYARFNK